MAGTMLSFMSFAWLAAALLCGAAMLWIWHNGEHSRPDHTPLLVAATFSALWCAVATGLGPAHIAAVLAVMARNLALIWAIFCLFNADGRAARVAPVRPVVAALVLVQLAEPLVLVMTLRAGDDAALARAAFEARSIMQMLVAIGTLMLLHNLYAGAAIGLRPILRWTGIGLAGIFAYDLNIATIAYLAKAQPLLLEDLRGLFAAVMVGLFALGMNAAGPRVQFSPSRAVAFRTLSLVLIAGYLAAMALVTKSLALIGGDMARVSQAMFVVVAVLAAAAALPSARVRGWLRVMATKHLFQHRYDYREEWLRFTRTIGRGAADDASLQVRAVKALADITESPAGLLLMPNEEARLELTARWNWAAIEVPAAAGNNGLSGLLEQHNLVLALDEARAGIDHFGERTQVPAWLIEADDAWAIVPLLHFDRLVGAIVLARPRTPRQLDWEDFDLLKVAGQQLASYLAEQAGQQALMDASRFDEFNRRMAFVMHDIKNLVSQLSLLAANAQKHADNPAFRADMIVTLRNSSDKLSALLARLGRYTPGHAHERSAIELVALARKVAQGFPGHPVHLTRDDPVTVSGNAETLEQALIHLVQNAIDASDPQSPVFIDVRAEGIHGMIDVVDAGAGMSAEFVRGSLFKPFVSSKPGGFGIGAFEARELVKAMGGRISVESREGLGTRFSIVLPIVEAARLIGAHHHQSASTKATA